MQIYSYYIYWNAAPNLILMRTIFHTIDIYMGLHIYPSVFRFFSVRKTHWHRWHWGISGFFFLWSGMCFCNALNVLNVQLHSPHITQDIPIHALSCSSQLCSFLNILPQFFLHSRSKGDFSIYFSHLCTVKFHQLVITWLHSTHW